MEIIIGVVVLVSVFAIFAGALVAKNLVYVCGPNEVLIFSGGRRSDQGGKTRGYRLIKGGRGMRVPLLEVVDRLDLTNMIIDVAVSNAYAKGGIPLNVSGVANVKIASMSPSLDNAIERFTGKSRAQIIKIAKETLEGNLRGVLSQLTPEQVNEDKILFAEKLLHEADHDLAKLGLDLDTLKIQNVSDERGFLDSIGRKQSAELIKNARIAEANARATAMVKEASNTQSARLAEIENERNILKAESERRIRDAQTRKFAMIAEERGQVKALLAKANAEINVQEARIKQVEKQLSADVLAPARANYAAAKEDAVAQAAKVLEDGKATVAVLNEMINTWQSGGDNARDIFLMQKLQTVMEQLLTSIDKVQIDKITVLPSTNDSNIGNTVRLVEELKSGVGVDVPQLLQKLTEK
ncbi:MAG: SPFH domain-containing protein [Myxococcota bacterium]|nr:SPFH domain-containing protein [Myxococcota bacterium]